MQQKFVKDLFVFVKAKLGFVKDIFDYLRAKLGFVDTEECMLYLNKKEFKRHQEKTIALFRKMFAEDPSIENKIAYCNRVYDGAVENEEFATYFITRYQGAFVTRNFLRLTYFFFLHNLFDEEKCLSYHLKGEVLAEIFIQLFNLSEKKSTVREYIQGKSPTPGFEEELDDIIPYNPEVDYIVKEEQNEPKKRTNCKLKITKWGKK